MSLSKEIKQDLFMRAVTLANKAADGGGIGSAIELSKVIRLSYKAMAELYEEIEEKG